MHSWGFQFDLRLVISISVLSVSELCSRMHPAINIHLRFIFSMVYVTLCSSLLQINLFQEPSHIHYSLIFSISSFFKTFLFRYLQLSGHCNGILFKMTTGSLLKTAGRKINVDWNFTCFLILLILQCISLHPFLRRGLLKRNDTLGWSTCKDLSFEHNQSFPLKRPSKPPKNHLAFLSPQVTMDKIIGALILLYPVSLVW